MPADFSVVLCSEGETNFDRFASSGHTPFRFSATSITAVNTAIITVVPRLQRCNAAVDHELAAR